MLFFYFVHFIPYIMVITSKIQNNLAIDLKQTFHIRYWWREPLDAHVRDTSQGLPSAYVITRDTKCIDSVLGSPVMTCLPPYMPSRWLGGTYKHLIMARIFRKEPQMVVACCLERVYSNNSTDGCYKVNEADYFNSFAGKGHWASLIQSWFNSHMTRKSHMVLTKTFNNRFT